MGVFSTTSEWYYRPIEHYSTPRKMLKMLSCLFTWSAIAKSMIVFLTGMRNFNMEQEYGTLKAMVKALSLWQKQNGMKQFMLFHAGWLLVGLFSFTFSSWIFIPTYILIQLFWTCRQDRDYTEIMMLILAFPPSCANLTCRPCTCKLILCWRKEVS